MSEPNPQSAKSSSPFGVIDIFGSPVQFQINKQTSYKTYVGCFWTISMAGLLLAAAIYYLLVYYNHTRVSVSSQLLQTSYLPVMNLSGAGQFIALVFLNESQFMTPGAVTPYFTVNGYVSTVVASNSSTVAPTVSVTQINFFPCQSINRTAHINGQDILGKNAQVLFNYGYCSQTNSTDPSTSSFILQGESGDDIYSYIELRVMPCIGPYVANGSIPQGSCALPYSNGNNTLSQADMLKIRLSLRSFRIGLFLFDATGDISNYDNPILYMLNTNFKFAPTSNQQKVIEIFYKTITVLTNQGVISTSYRNNTSYAVGEVNYDSLDRDPNDRTVIQTPNGPQVQPIPYMTLRFLSSNTQLQYTRTYLMLLDIAGLVGGVSQVFTFVVLILYQWYNALKMTQEIINRTVLNIDEEDQMEEWERKRLFTFGEVFKFTYLKCLYKKQDRCKMYERCKGHVSEKIDIIKIIRTSNDVEVMKRSLLPEHTLKLMKYVTISDAGDGNEHKKLTYTNAMKMLVKEKGSEDEGEARRRVGKYILEKLPAEAPGVSDLPMSPSAKKNEPSTKSAFNFELNPLQGPEKIAEASPKSQTKTHIIKEVFTVADRKLTQSSSDGINKKVNFPIMQPTPLPGKLQGDVGPDALN